jgi:hypothetical protein
MGRCPLAGRVARRVCGLWGLLLAGCMPLGYAYPTISYVPAARVGAARDEVKAFRIDIVDDDNCFEIKEQDRYVLTPLPLHRDGSYDPQMKFGLTYGWMWNCIALTYGGSTERTVMVRLYRPGYRTLEVRSWQKDGPLQWTEAPMLEEQEEAIDDLVSTWRTAGDHLQTRFAAQGFVPPREPIVFRSLAPGSAGGPHHCATLRFAASEYERLLKDATKPDLHNRLEEKAKALRQLAAK